MVAPFLPSISLDSPSGFTPRPYPPPCLDGVPRVFQLDCLRAASEGLFNNSTQSDCTVVIPFNKHASRISQDPCILSSHSRQQCISNDLKAEHPILMRTSCGDQLGVMHLHVDYLAPFSRLLRAFFAGMTPRDYINRIMRSHTSIHCSSSLDPAPSDISSFEGRVPQLLARASSDRAVLFLPLPDPASFHYIAHWMYFGKTDLILNALRQGTITWSGLARNGAFLGMTEEFQAMIRELRSNSALYHVSTSGDWYESDGSDFDDDRDKRSTRVFDVDANIPVFGDESDLDADSRRRRRRHLNRSPYGSRQY